MKWRGLSFEHWVGVAVGEPAPAQWSLWELGPVRRSSSREGEGRRGNQQGWEECTGNLVHLEMYPVPALNDQHWTGGTVRVGGYVM